MDADSERLYYTDRLERTINSNSCGDESNVGSAGGHGRNVIIYKEHPFRQRKESLFQFHCCGHANNVAETVYVDRLEHTLALDNEVLSNTSVDVCDLVSKDTDNITILSCDISNDNSHLVHESRDVAKEHDNGGDGNRVEHVDRGTITFQQHDFPDLEKLQETLPLQHTERWERTEVKDDFLINDTIKISQLFHPWKSSVVIKSLSPVHDAGNNMKDSDDNDEINMEQANTGSKTMVSEVKWSTNVHFHENKNHEEFQASRQKINITDENNSFPNTKEVYTHSIQGFQLERREQISAPDLITVFGETPGTMQSNILSDVGNTQSADENTQAVHGMSDLGLSAADTYYTDRWERSECVSDSTDNQIIVSYWNQPWKTSEEPNSTLSIHNYDSNIHKEIHDERLRRVVDNQEIMPINDRPLITHDDVKGGQKTLVSSKHLVKRKIIEVDENDFSGAEIRHTSFLNITTGSELKKNQHFQVSEFNTRLLKIIDTDVIIRPREHKTSCISELHVNLPLVVSKDDKIDHLSDDLSSKIIMACGSHESYVDTANFLYSSEDSLTHITFNTPMNNGSDVPEIFSNVASKPSTSDTKTAFIDDTDLGYRQWGNKENCTRYTSKNENSEFIRKHDSAYSNKDGGTPFVLKQGWEETENVMKTDSDNFRNRNDETELVVKQRVKSTECVLKNDSEDSSRDGDTEHSVVLESEDTQYFNENVSNNDTESMVKQKREATQYLIENDNENVSNGDTESMVKQGSEDTQYLTENDIEVYDTEYTVESDNEIVSKDDTECVVKQGSEDTQYLTENDNEVYDTEYTVQNDRYDFSKGDTECVVKQGSEDTQDLTENDNAVYDTEYTVENDSYDFSKGDTECVVKQGSEDTQYLTENDNEVDDTEYTVENDSYDFSKGDTECVVKQGSEDTQYLTENDNEGYDTEYTVENDRYDFSKGDNECVVKQRSEDTQYLTENDNEVYDTEYTVESDNENVSKDDTECVVNQRSEDAQYLKENDNEVYDTEYTVENDNENVSKDDTECVVNQRGEDTQYLTENDNEVYDTEYTVQNDRYDFSKGDTECVVKQRSEDTQYLTENDNEVYDTEYTVENDNEDVSKDDTVCVVNQSSEDTQYLTENDNEVYDTEYTVENDSYDFSNDDTVCVVKQGSEDTQYLKENDSEVYDTEYTVENDNENVSKDDTVCVVNQRSEDTQYLTENDNEVYDTEYTVENDNENVSKDDTECVVKQGSEDTQYLKENDNEVYDTEYTVGNDNENVSKDDTECVVKQGSEDTQYLKENDNEVYDTEYTVGNDNENVSKDKTECVVKQGSEDTQYLTENDNEVYDTEYTVGNDNENVSKDETECVVNQRSEDTQYLKENDNEVYDIEYTVENDRYDFSKGDAECVVNERSEDTQYFMDNFSENSRKADDIELTYKQGDEDTEYLFRKIIADSGGDDDTQIVVLHGGESTDSVMKNIIDVSRNESDTTSVVSGGDEYVMENGNRDSRKYDTKQQGEMGVEDTEYVMENDYGDCRKKGSELVKQCNESTECITESKSGDDRLDNETQIVLKLGSEVTEYSMGNVTDNFRRVCDANFVTNQRSEYTDKLIINTIEDSRRCDDTNFMTFKKIEDSECSIQSDSENLWTSDTEIVKEQERENSKLITEHDSKDSINIDQYLVVKQTDKTAECSSMENNIADSRPNGGTELEVKLECRDAENVIENISDDSKTFGDTELSIKQVCEGTENIENCIKMYVENYVTANNCNQIHENAESIPKMFNARIEHHIVSQSEIESSGTEERKHNEDDNENETFPWNERLGKEFRLEDTEGENVEQNSFSNKTVIQSESHMMEQSITQKTDNILLGNLLEDLEQEIERMEHFIHAEKDAFLLNYFTPLVDSVVDSKEEDLGSTNISRSSHHVHCFPAAKNFTFKQDCISFDTSIKSSNNIDSMEKTMSGTDVGCENPTATLSSSVLVTLNNSSSEDIPMGSEEQKITSKIKYSVQTKDTGDLLKIPVPLTKLSENVPVKLTESSEFYVSQISGTTATLENILTQESGTYSQVNLIVENTTKPIDTDKQRTIYQQESDSNVACNDCALKVAILENNCENGSNDENNVKSKQSLVSIENTDQLTIEKLSGGKFDWEVDLKKHNDIANKQSSKPSANSETVNGHSSSEIVSFEVPRVANKIEETDDVTRWQLQDSSYAKHEHTPHIVTFGDLAYGNTNLDMKSKISSDIFANTLSDSIVWVPPNVAPKKKMQAPDVKAVLQTQEQYQRSIRDLIAKMEKLNIALVHCLDVPLETGIRKYQEIQQEIRGLKEDISQIKFISEQLLNSPNLGAHHTVGATMTMLIDRSRDLETMAENTGRQLQSDPDQLMMATAKKQTHSQSAILETENRIQYTDEIYSAEHRLQTWIVDDAEKLTTPFRIHMLDGADLMYRNIEINQTLEKKVTAENFQFLHDQYQKLLNESEFYLATVLYKLQTDFLTARDLSHLRQQLTSHKEFFDDLEVHKTILESLASQCDLSTRAKFQQQQSSLTSLTLVLIDQGNLRGQRLWYLVHQWAKFDEKYFKLEKVLNTVESQMPAQVLPGDSLSVIQEKCKKFKQLHSELTTERNSLFEIVDEGREILHSVTCPTLEKLLTELADKWIFMNDHITCQLKSAESLSDQLSVFETEAAILTSWLNATMLKLSNLRQLTAHDLQDIRTVTAKMKDVLELQKEVESKKKLKNKVSNAGAQLMQNSIYDQQSLPDRLSDYEVNWLQLQSQLSEVHKYLCKAQIHPIPSHQALNEILSWVNEMNRILLLDANNKINTATDIEIMVNRYRVYTSELADWQMMLDFANQQVLDSQAEVHAILDEKTEYITTLDKLNKDWRNVTSDVTERLKSLEIVLSDWEVFKACFDSLHSWLQSHEDEIQQYKMIGCKLEVKHALQELQATQKLLETKKSDLTSLMNLGNQLIELSGREHFQCSESVINSLSVIDHKWKGLHKKIKHYECLLKDALEQWNCYHKKLACLHKITNQIEYALYQQIWTLGDIDILRSKATNVKNLQSDLNGSSHLESFCTLASQLQQVCELNIQADIRKTVSNTQMKCMQLSTDLAARYIQIEKCLEQWQDFESQCNQICDWLNFGENHCADLIMLDPNERHEALRKCKQLQHNLDGVQEHISELYRASDHFTKNANHSAIIVISHLSAIEQRMLTLRQNLTKNITALTEDVTTHVRFRETVHVVENVLANAAGVLAEHDPISTDKNIIKERLVKLKQLVLLFISNSFNLDAVNDLRHHLCLDEANASRLRDLNHDWQKLYKDAIDRTRMLQSSLPLHQDFSSKWEMWMAFVTKTEQDLAVYVNGDLNDLIDQLYMCQLCESEIFAREHFLHALITDGEKLMTVGEIDETFHQKLHLMVEQFQSLCTRANQKKALIKTLISQWQEFSVSCQRLKNWLHDKENVLKTFESDLSSLQMITVLREKVQKIRQELRLHEVMHQKMCDLGNTLLLHADETEAARIKDTVTSLQQLWDTVLNSLDANQLHLDNLDQECLECEDVINDLLNWLRSAHVMLHKDIPTTHDELLIYLSRCEETLSGFRNLEDKHKDLLTKEKEMFRLIPRDGFNILHERIKLLHIQWVELQQQAILREQKVKQMLSRWTDFDKRMQSIIDRTDSFIEAAGSNRDMHVEDLLTKMKTVEDSTVVNAKGKQHFQSESATFHRQINANATYQFELKPVKSLAEIQTSFSTLRNFNSSVISTRSSDQRSESSIILRSPTSSLVTHTGPLSSERFSASPSRQTIGDDIASTRQDIEKSSKIEILLHQLVELLDNCDVKLTRLESALTDDGDIEQKIHWYIKCETAVDHVERQDQLIKTETGFMANESIDAQIMILLQRWENLKRLTIQQDFTVSKDNYDHVRFVKEIDNILTWLSEAEVLQSLHQSLPSDIAQLDVIVRQFKDFKIQLESKNISILTINLLSLKYLDAKDSESMQLQEKFDDMNSRWQLVLSKAKHTEKILQVSLIQCQEFHHKMHDYQLWLEDIEVCIHTCEPVHLNADDSVRKKYARLLELTDELQRSQLQLMSLRDTADQVLMSTASLEVATARSKVHSLHSHMQALVGLISSYRSALEKRLQTSPNGENTPLSAVVSPVFHSRNQDNSRMITEPETASQYRKHAVHAALLMRVIHAALPIYLLFLLLFLLLCLLPVCEDEYQCTFGNNLHHSVSPMLRYTDGAPPT